MTISEMLAECIDSRMIFPTYAIVWALQNNKIYEDDDAELVSLINLDEAAVQSMIAQDPLQIERIKAFAVSTHKGIHHMIFAENSQSAIECLGLKSKPLSVKDVSSRLHIEFWDSELGLNVSLKGMLQNMQHFPSYAFTLNTNQETLEETVHEYYRFDR